ncbi:[FeFe] hydrogenase H-cluster maturation GTPase HydF [Hathewaya histolytica]|uniref:[FeFe] hydrogenase H-cluster maturation GTPase HydF n=1 Tax=Hathewaya histolytica TaxID=1498 RepID=UPI003B679F14
MNTTPNANRLHIGIFGKTNSGKSSITNALTGQEVSIVSSIKGTTTDPVSKSMEFLPIGPVVFIDTAGVEDKSDLGEAREEKTLKVLDKIDLALYVIDSTEYDNENEYKILNILNKRNIPYIKVFNKVDLIQNNELERLKDRNRNSLFLSALNNIGFDKLKETLIQKLKSTEKEETLIGDILPYGSTAILVVPIDSEAPKGRLILPQVQLIRDALDHGIKSYVVRDTELKEALQDLKKVDLVITDSKDFKKVSNIVPSTINLTSFSILMARQKGDLKQFIEGVNKINKLSRMSKVLIMESCAHNTSHEDIGTIKIPKLLNKYLGFDLNYEFSMGEDFKEKDIQKYDFVIHCGSCMLTRNIMKRRMEICKENNVSITNYGIILAYLTDVLERSIKIFRKEL